MSGVPDLISGQPASAAVGVSHTKIKPKAAPEQVAQSQSRTAAIREAFREIGAVNGNPLNSNEILRLLNQKLQEKSQGVYSAEAFKLIYQEIGKSPADSVAIEEFIDGYVAAENRLIEQVNTFKREIAKDTKVMEQKNRQLIQERPNEGQVNQHGIMIGSQLTVTVHGCQNLSQGEGLPQVSLNCEGQNFQTKPGPNKEQPQWMETYTFNITTGLDTLKVEVKSVSREYEKFLGKVSVPLGDLRHQKQVSHQAFALNDQQERQPWNGTIVLTLQWIWKQTMYLEDLIKELRAKNESDQQNLQEMTLLLHSIQAPFGAWGSTSAIGGMNIPMMGTIDRYLHNFDPYADKVDEVGERLIGRQIKWDNASFLAIVLYLVLTI